MTLLRWTSGTCVPEELLGLDGYLPAKQQNLETLKLIINPRCSEDYVNSFFLSEFKKLKYFFLEGAKSSEDERAVANVLRGSSQTLIELELYILPKEPLTPWIGSTWHASKLFSLDYLHLDWPPANFVYPKLRVLSLTFISFEDSEASLPKVIDLPSLTRMTLRHCRGWGNLLREMCDTGRSMSLRWLEIQYDKVENGDIKTIVDFLQCCPNLENLAVLHGQHMCHFITFKIWEAACLGKINFRGFVFHIVDVRSSMDFPSPRALESLDLLVATSTYIAVPDKNPFTHTNLDFLGLCCHPDEALVSKSSRNLPYFLISLPVALNKHVCLS